MVGLCYDIWVGSKAEIEQRYDVLLNNKGRSDCEFCEKGDGQYIGLSQGVTGREVFACKNCIANDEACGEFISLHEMLIIADNALYEESQEVQQEIIVKKNTKAPTKVAKNSVSSDPAKLAKEFGTRLSLVEDSILTLTDAVTEFFAQLENVQEPEVVQDSPKSIAKEPKAKTDHQKMGEQNEARGLMYTARFACRDCGPKQTGFYKLASAEGHAQRKGHKIGTLTFDL